MKRMALVPVVIVMCLVVHTESVPALESACIPDASFVSDVTVPDDTILKPGELFEKVWRLKNTGDCAWNEQYALVHVDGDPLGTWGALPPAQTIEPGATVDIGVKMQAPRQPGTYTGWWQMRDPTGVFFGDRVYARIVVGGEPAAAPAAPVMVTEPTRPPAAETLSPSSTPVASPAETVSSPDLIASPPASAAPVPAGPTLAGKIAFTVLNSAYQPPMYDLYVANANGTGRQLIAQRMRQPHMRADGMILAKGQGPDQDNLYVMDGDGSSQRQVSPFGTDERPSWAPEGDSFAFSNRQERAVIVQDALQRDAVRNALRCDMHPLMGKHVTWLPDGRVLYNGCNVWGSSGTCGLYIADRAGGLPVNLTTDPSDLSPEVHEHKVVFMSHRDGNWDIYRINIDGSGLRRLSDDPANDGLPTWSPFGHLIAFLSDRGGTWAVWVMEIDGSRPRKLFDLGGPMGEDWIEDRISWHAWPAGVAAPLTPTPAPVLVTPTPESTTKTLAFSDAFTDTLSGLPDEPSKQCGGYYEGEQYHLVFTRDKCGRNYAIATYDSDYKYFVIEVSIGRLEGEGEHLGSGEIIFGYRNDANYYGAAVSRWGRFYRLYRVRDGAWQDLIPWTEGGSLHDVRGAADPKMPVWDRVRLVVQGLPQGGAKMELFGNGAFFSAVVDQYYDGGAVGFGVHAGGRGHVAVDDFVIQPLP